MRVVVVVRVCTCGMCVLGEAGRGVVVVCACGDWEGVDRPTDTYLRERTFLAEMKFGQGNLGECVCVCV